MKYKLPILQVSIHSSTFNLQPSTFNLQPSTFILSPSQELSPSPAISTASLVSALSTRCYVGMPGLSDNLQQEEL